MKRFKKLFVIGIIFGLGIAGVAAFFAFNSSPDELTEEEKEAAVAEILGRKPNLDPDVKTGSIRYDGELLSFSYPARATIYDYVPKSAENNESELERFSFDIDVPRLILNYTAVNKSLNNIKDEPSVKLREDESRGYISEEVLVDGISVNSYKREGSGSVRSEKSVFILQDGVIYTISITGNSLEDIEELFAQIIVSAKFN